MSFLSFFKKKKERISLLIDVSDGKADVAIVSFVKNQLPRFIYNDSDPFLSSSLESVMEKGWSKINWKNKNRIFSHIIVSLSSKWLVSKTKEINLFQEKPFIITERFINEITSREEKLFEEELLSGFSEDSNNRFQVIEKSIIHTNVNGYVIDNLFGRKTKQLNVFLHMSAISKKIEDSISNIVLKNTHIPKENILIQGFPLILFLAVRNHFEKDADFILVNIGLETTDVILVNNHTIKSTASFSFGTETIIRKFVEIFNISQKTAQSHLNMYLSGKINNSGSKAVENLLGYLEKEWSVQFENALFEISPKMILPKKVFVVVDDKIESIFTEFLKQSREDINIIHLSESSLSHLYRNEFKKCPSDNLVFLALFYNQLI